MKRYKIIICLACLLGGFMLFVNPKICEAGEPHTVHIVENDWPPYYFAGKPNMPEGFAKELLKMCISGTGYKCKFDFYPVKRMYSYIEKGKIDLVLFSYKKSRESLVIYGKEPIFSSGYRPVILAESDIQIESLKDFDRLRVGHLAGLKYSKSFLEYIEKRKREGSLIIATIGNSCIKMLLSGMIDVFVDTKDTILWRAKQMNALDKIKILDFDFQTKAYFITVSKQSKTLTDKQGFLNKLDQCIKTAKKNGNYSEIARKYGLE